MVAAAFANNDYACVSGSIIIVAVIAYCILVSKPE